MTRNPIEIPQKKNIVAGNVIVKFTLIQSDVRCDRIQLAQNMIERHTQINAILNNRFLKRQGMC